MTVERRIDPRLFPPPDYSHVAVATGRSVFTAGAVPLDGEGRLVGAGNVVAQTRQVVENLLSALETGGATADDVAKTTIYVVSDHTERLLEVWETVRHSPFAEAPSTLVGVSALGYRGQLVEIEAVAVID